jgi:ribosomal protein S27E
VIRVRDYACPTCGHRFEVFASAHDDTEVCMGCCGTAVLQPSAPRSQLEGTTGSFPGAAMAWERKRAQQIAIEKRRERDHGDDGWR